MAKKRIKAKAGKPKKSIAKAATASKIRKGGKPERVEPEQVVGGRAGTAGTTERREILLEGVVRREQRGEDRDEGEDPDQPHADEGAGVATQPAPGVAPEAGRGLELDLPRFDLGDAH